VICVILKYFGPAIVQGFLFYENELQKIKNISGALRKEIDMADNL
jgi:hypothetical protein